MKVELKEKMKNDLQKMISEWKGCSEYEVLSVLLSSGLSILAKQHPGDWDFHAIEMIRLAKNAVDASKIDLNDKDVESTS